MLLGFPGKRRVNSYPLWCSAEGCSRASGGSGEELKLPSAVDGVVTKGTFGSETSLGRLGPVQFALFGWASARYLVVFLLLRIPLVDQDSKQQPTLLLPLLSRPVSAVSAFVLVTASFLFCLCISLCYPFLRREPPLSSRPALAPGHNSSFFFARVLDDTATQSQYAVRRCLHADSPRILQVWL